MAPKFTSKIVTFSLALALLFSAIPIQVFADTTTVHEQVLKFYLDPTLVPDLNFAKAVLPKYVADMNVILSKNTSRRLIFDPETGIILTSTKPQTDSAQPPLPTEGFEIWAYAVRTDNTLSYGGYAGMDRSGAGVLAGLKWTRLYDPENLAGNQVTDYAIQLDHMLHELAHIFGAGIGEYYNLSSITDSTGLEPFLNIKLSDPADGFWSTKPDFMTDPLLRFTSPASRTDYLARVQYSNLTAAVIDGAYRNGMPGFDTFTIQLRDRNGAAIPDANIKVWNVTGGAGNTSELLFDGFSDENGQVTIPWGGTRITHTASNFLRLIKAYKNGSSIAQPRYFSIFDADTSMLVSHESAITVSLEPLQPKAETYASIGSNDGWVLESSQGSQTGGSLNTDAGSFLLGDNAANRQYRSILSFNTDTLPENAVITKVTIKLLKQTVNGTDPFTTHGNLQVDVREGVFSTKASMQKVDFQASPDQSNVGGPAVQTTDNWVSIDLNEQAYGFINLSGVSQFRLQFELSSDRDGMTDTVKFSSGNSANSAKRPQLIIEYYVP